MWSGRNEWAPIPVQARRGLVRAVFRHVARWKSPSGHPAPLFAVSVHKRSKPGRDPTQLALEEVFMRFDEFLTRLHSVGESHRSLVIADDSSYEKLVQSWVPKWKAGGTRGGKLHSFAEVPLYVDSKASRLVQVADFVAWATWHYYEHGHTEFFQKIHPMFDSNGGIQHGLAHLNRKHSSCLCQACSSRRAFAIRDMVTPHPL